MKLSKSLLQAIALGVTISATTTSCSLFENSDVKPNLHDKTCAEDCQLDHRNSEGSTDWSNCPGCGMG
ncbi:chryseobasin-related MNIO class RiPP peptide [Flavilitoribacter nigricans]|uniref:Lipoprotein n=1 Tax=Flavilitoribacter nigricans (strain ATCC 23147 / DSM 23189 / NBRC 102662 / NCIMB 1420 / SS-2) TaxID=1122177 RepID=A0A2D0NIR0_FLAN2|nr:hypothetical protein [Flavilitoribacter nigricans]PHN07643.1 hypothetical protein CRP01_05965 [Flavilitoribacter nigricans DSM 23189 = NBRC 102662]